MSMKKKIVLCLGACVLAAGAWPSNALGLAEVQDITVNGVLVWNDDGTPNGYLQVLPGDNLEIVVTAALGGELPPYSWGCTRIRLAGANHCFDHANHEGTSGSAVETFNLVVPADACGALELEVRLYHSGITSCSGIVHSLDAAVKRGVIVVGPQSPIVVCQPDFSINGCLTEPDELGNPNKQLTITKEQLFVSGDPRCGTLRLIKAERRNSLGQWVQPAMFTCADIGTEQRVRLTVGDTMEGYYDPSLPSGGLHWWESFGYCETKILIQDCAAPTICACPVSQVLDVNGTCKTTLPDYTDWEVTCSEELMTFKDARNIYDNCTPSANLVVTQYPAPGTPYPPINPPYPQDWEGCPQSWPVQTVTLTVTDASGNYSYCSFEVGFDDITPPTITCPGNIVTPQDPTDCHKLITLLPPTVTDNCLSINCPVSFDHDQLPFPCAPRAADEVCLETLWQNGTIIGYRGFFPVGETVITWTGEDCCGNAATCTQSVRVLDVQPPTITCPENIEVEAEHGECGAYVSTSQPVVADNCRVMSVVSDHPDPWYPVGDTTVTWTVTDVDGNTATCQQLVTVLDTQSPILCVGIYPSIFFAQTSSDSETELCPEALVTQLLADLGVLSPFRFRWDNCAITEVFPIDGFDIDGNPIPHVDCYETGNHFGLMFVAQDAAGNTSPVCVLDVTIILGPGGPPPPTGACCLQGYCATLAQPMCLAWGGQYIGGACTPDLCGTELVTPPTTPGSGTPQNPPGTTQLPSKLDKEPDTRETTTPTPAPVFGLCGASASITMTLMLVGLIGLKITRRRR